MLYFTWTDRSHVYVLELLLLFVFILWLKKKEINFYIYNYIIPKQPLTNISLKSNTCKRLGMELSSWKTMMSQPYKTTLITDKYNIWTLYFESKITSLKKCFLSLINTPAMSTLSGKIFLISTHLKLNVTKEFEVSLDKQMAAICHLLHKLKYAYGIIQHSLDHVRNIFYSKWYTCTNLMREKLYISSNNNFPKKFLFPWVNSVLEYNPPPQKKTLIINTCL